MEQDAKKTIERCSKNIRIGMLTDKLKLNEDKNLWLLGRIISLVKCILVSCQLVILRLSQ